MPIINKMLADAHALPHLYKHDDFPWHLHGTEPDAPFAERVRVEIALALVDVIRSGETHRLRVCGADDCEGLFVDMSRNGSKRYLQRALRQPHEHDRVPRAAVELIGETLVTPA